MVEDKSSIVFAEPNAAARIALAPTLIMRGEWDSLCTDTDARKLFDALSGAPLRRDVKISGGTHLVHLESSRYALHRETATFLLAGDIP